MSHTAQTTYYGLPIYEDKAGNQPTYLGDWNEAMRTLDSSLNSVAGQSSGVVNTANQALSTAQQAQQTANAANTVANSAQQTASGLSSRVTTAQETAEAANTAAGTAQSTAESANSTAQQASTTASNALSQAQKAASTAGTAQSTAQSALSTANTAAQKLTGIAKIAIVTTTFNNSGGNEYVTINGSQIMQWLGESSTTGKTLFVYVINGDINANQNLSIRTIAIDTATWNTRVWLGNTESTAFRFNIMVGYANA